MNQKSILRAGLTCLVALLLLVNAANVAASADFGQSSGKVFTVSPSGGDDTANIQHAFDRAVAAGAGSTVKLAAGNFHTRFIEVWKFDGTFKGAGQNLTVIDTFADQDCQKVTEQNRLPALFNFFQGNVQVSDIGFHITPATPCKPYPFGGIQPGYVASGLSVLSITPAPFIPATDCKVLQKGRVSGSISRVTFQGEMAHPPSEVYDPMNANIIEPILMGGAYSPFDLTQTDCTYMLTFAQGSFNVTDSTFRRTIEGVVVEYTYNSTVKISGNSTDLTTNGIVLEDSSGSKVEISNNTVKRGSWSGVWVWHGGMAKVPYIDSPAIYDIHDNRIEAEEVVAWDSTGVIAWDLDTMGNSNFPPIARTALFSIRNNRMLLSPFDPPGSEAMRGVWLEGVDGAAVANNTISGSGTNAIYAGSWGTSQNVLITGNNLTGFSPYASNPYKIVLDWGTKKYVVVGEPVANVANYGTDNLVAGQIFQTPHRLAQGVQDSMKQFFGTLKTHPFGFH